MKLKASVQSRIQRIIPFMITTIGVMFLFSMPHAPAADTVEVSQHGKIDWKFCNAVSSASASFETNEKGIPISLISETATSLNRARSEAYLRAKESALEKLASTLRSMRVDGEKTIADIIGEKEEARGKLSEMIAHAVSFREKPGGFNTSVCEASIRFGDLIAALAFDFQELPLHERDDAKIRTDYTSLIIDARGLGIRPMLLPSVYTDHGLEMFGPRFAKAASARKSGLASYCTSEDEAMAHKKAGRRPYYIAAIRALRGCPVIADRDARRILASPVTKENLKNCKLIIILSSKDR
jgi:hypothetical protein